MQRDYSNYYPKTISQQEEALEMHQYWNEKYLKFMMICVDENSKIEKLIDKAERESKYWLDKYNALTAVG